MKILDAVIVGAGPAGSATAISLARNGYNVALIDKQQFPREKLCGDFVNPINWPVFRELGVEERILAEAHSPVTGFRITSPTGESAEALFSASSEAPCYGLGLMRARLDDVLLQRASEVGAMIKTGCRLRHISKNPSGWELETSTGEAWTAKILVGADGRNSWLAKRLGMTEQSGQRSRSVGFQMRLNCAEASGRVEIHLFPGGYAGFINVGGGTATLGLAIDKNALSGRDAVSLLSERLAKNPFLKRILRRYASGDRLRSAYPVYLPKRRSYAEAVLLVGDAARVTEPVSGEGIYFALTSGILAARTLDDALRKGDVSEHLLANYEQACRRALRRRLFMNSLLRFAVYRPALLNRMIHWSATNNRLLRAIVDQVCIPATSSWPS